MNLLKTVLLAVSLLTFSVSANAQFAAAQKVANEFNLSGNIKGAGDVKVTLEKLGVDGIYATTTAKGGKFEFVKCKGTLPHPFKLTVGNKVMYVALDNGKISMIGDINDLQNAKLDGASSHGEYMVLLGMLSKCKNDMEKEVAMETFMSNHSHSWISLYCLEYLHKKYPNQTQKMRQLMSYVQHFKGGKNYDDIDKAVSAVEAEEE